MRVKLLLSLALSALLLFGCETEAPETQVLLFPSSSAEAETSGQIHKETVSSEKLDTLPLETFDVTAEETSPPDPFETQPVTTEHVHRYFVVSVEESTCQKNGQEIEQCSCGSTQTKRLFLAEHTAGEGSCTDPVCCTKCGTVLSPKLSHLFEGNVCKRCGYALSDPIYVLGECLRFDEKASSIEEKLGTPSALVNEGDLVSYVYASEPSEFTVIQTDANGLWGVFTMDPDARLLLGNHCISIASFSGQKDPDSEAYYQNLGSCRVFGFRDSLSSGEYYALWMRYAECEYDYMTDDRLFSGFFGQSMLSFWFTNALRAKNGLSPLVWSEEAAAVAREYSQYMISSGFFGHDNSYAERLSQKGISWTYAGENVSQGYFNAFFVVDAYYNSKSHRDNILSSDFTHGGMGYVLCPDPRSVYGAQIFFAK